MVYPALAGLGAEKAALLSLSNNLNAELKPKGSPFMYLLVLSKS